MLALPRQRCRGWLLLLLFFFLSLWLVSYLQTQTFCYFFFTPWPLIIATFFIVHGLKYTGNTDMSDMLASLYMQVSIAGSTVSTPMQSAPQTAEGPAYITLEVVLGKGWWWFYHNMMLMLLIRIIWTCLTLPNGLYQTELNRLDTLLSFFQRITLSSGENDNRALIVWSIFFRVEGKGNKITRITKTKITIGEKLFEQDTYTVHQVENPRKVTW